MSNSLKDAEIAHSSHEEPESNTPAARPAATRRVAMGTLARLAVGSALLGWKIMTAALEAEDEDVAGEAPAQAEGPLAAPPAGAPDGEQAARLRHALIGMTFDTGERAARRAGAALEVAERTTRALRRPAARWARRSRLLAPARRRYEALVERGEAQVERWVERGQAEAAHSQALVETALVQAVDTSMDHVLENPKVQELVEEQSTGLSQEVVEELRERAVTLDMLVERLVGRVLRRPTSRMQAPLVVIPVPVEDATGTVQSLAGQPAGFVSRLVAFIIDVVAISVAFVATSWLLDAVRSVLGVGIVLSRLPVFSPEIAFGGLQLSATTVFWVGYLLLFWTVSGRTPGKAVLGLRVVTRDGHRLSLGRSLLRLVGYVLSTILLYLGFLWVAVDARQRAWHDHLAGTYVVYSWDAHTEERFLAEQLRDLAAEDSGDG